MDKPISIKINELCEGMADLLNKSEIPFYIVVPYMESMLAQVKQVAEQQKKIELKEYQEYLKAQKEGELDV